MRALTLSIFFLAAVTCYAQVNVDKPVTISTTTFPQLRANNPTNATGTTAGIRFDTGSGWDVRLRTNQGNSWLELTDNTNTAYQRWDAGNYYPGNSSAYITTGSGNANIALMNGNVGIGVASPITTLDIRGTSPEVRILETVNTSNVNLALGDGVNNPAVTTEGLRIIYESATGHSYIRNLYSSGSLKLQTNGANDRMVISSSGSVTIPALAGSGTRFVVADASGTLSTIPSYILTSTAQADALGLPSGIYMFNFPGSTGPQLLFYQDNIDGSLGYVRVFSSPFAGAATVNFVGQSFPFTKFLIQTAAGGNKSTAYFASTRLFNTDNSTTTANGGTHNGYRVFIGGGGSMGIYNTSQNPCSWADGGGAVGSGYDGSCGTFPDALRWGTGVGGTPFYNNVVTTWEIWIAN